MLARSPRRHLGFGQELRGGAGGARGEAEQRREKTRGGARGRGGALPGGENPAESHGRVPTRLGEAARCSSLAEPWRAAAP